MYGLHSNRTNSRLPAAQQTQQGLRQGYASGRYRYPRSPGNSAARLAAFCVDSKQSSGPSAIGRGAGAATSKGGRDVEKNPVTTSSTWPTVQPPSSSSSSKPAQPASSASRGASTHRAPEPQPLSDDEAARERKRRAALPIWPRGSLAVAILGGGEADSQRLWPLTRYRTLPAIPFGGVHRCGACTLMPLLCVLRGPLWQGGSEDWQSGQAEPCGCKRQA